MNEAKRNELNESNGSGFYVFTTVKAGFEPTYSETKIKKGEVELSLTHDEVIEMISTLKGKRGNISSSEMDGYVPKETYLYSQNELSSQTTKNQ